jgi:hypothetical protein
VNVPFLSASQIEMAAATLLRRFAASTGREIRGPVPVEDIIEKYLGLIFEICDLQEFLGVSDVLGATWFGLNVIRVDERLLEKEGRFCFTLGHELGHWILHRPRFELEERQQLLGESPRERPPSVVCRRSERRATAEWQADQFAAHVLMPAELVKLAFTREHDGPVELAELLTPSDAVSVRWVDAARVVIRSGNFSNVSVEAMRYRLRELGLVRAASAQTRLF